MCAYFHICMYTHNIYVYISINTNNIHKCYEMGFYVNIYDRTIRLTKYSFFILNSLINFKKKCNSQEQSVL